MMWGGIFAGMANLTKNPEGEIIDEYWVLKDTEYLDPMGNPVPLRRAYRYSKLEDAQAKRHGSTRIIKVVVAQKEIDVTGVQSP